MNYFIVVIFFYLSPLSFADILILDHSVKENYSNNIKVSSEGYLLGFHFYTESKDKDLFLHFPEKSSGYICLQISSIDGKYKAQIEHKLEYPVSGASRLVYPSQFKHKLKKYSSKQLAVLARLKPSSCDSSNSLANKILLASWGKSASSRLVALIRSHAKIDEMHYPSIADSKTSVICRKFKDADPVRYDKYCLLDVGDRIHNSVEIDRKLFKKPLASENINFYHVDD